MWATSDLWQRRPSRTAREGLGATTGREVNEMEVILRAEPKEIAALVVGLQERQLSELSEKVVENLAEGLIRSAASVHTPG